jgi:hypothetical protein
MKGAHAAPAYVRIGVMYILSRRIRVPKGIGLFLLSMEYSIPRVWVAFLIMLDTCTSKLSFRPIVTPRYFT